MLQVAFTAFAISFGLWTIKQIKSSEEERTRKYNVQPPKTPEEFQVVEETSIKVRYPRTI